MTDQDDARFMALALALGRRGLGRTAPNPSVGCVLVRGGRIVGRGWTADGGRPHAETRALEQAGPQARGATAYVTLEPCAHTGQTPPCAEALVQAGLSRVVIACEDHDPRVAGQGAARLRAAGVQTDIGVGASEAAQAHAGFFARLRGGRPLVTLKLAMSFDGRIATGSGDSQWITGPDARRAVHALRARHDAVMVGGATARMDNPQLTVRGFGAVRQPVRVVLSRRLDLPLTGHLARSARDIPLVLCHGPDLDPARRAAWRDLGAQLVGCAVRAGHLDPGDVLTRLGDLGLTRVFCEGGSAVAASLLAHDCVDRLIGFGAGVVIGAEGLPAIGGLGLSKLSEAPRFDLHEARTVGADVLADWRRRP